jgi:hypothetical protein
VLFNSQEEFSENVPDESFVYRDPPSQFYNLSVLECLLRDAIMIHVPWPSVFTIHAGYRGHMRVTIFIPRDSYIAVRGKS